MPETIALRLLGGRFLRELREDRGYSPTILTNVVGPSTGSLRRDGCGSKTHRPRPVRSLSALIDEKCRGCDWGHGHIERRRREPASSDPLRA